MRPCRRSILCSDCPDIRACPACVRRDKRARRTMSDSASLSLVKRAAGVLSGGWYTCLRLGESLYGAPKAGNRSSRMSIMVRARRTVNRLKKLGVLAVRPDAKGTAEYTLLPDGKEVLGC